MQGPSCEEDDSCDIEVVQLWRLPDDFFQMDLPAQWKAVKHVTMKAVKLKEPRKPCKMSMCEDALCVAFFLINLALIWVLAATMLVLLFMGSNYFKWSAAATAVLAFHPMPSFSVPGRSNRFTLAFIRYFSFEVLIDRKKDVELFTSEVDKKSFLEAQLPLLCLACPHGVFNYGAMAWCCISRWICGWYQYTGSILAVKYLPGLRYLDLLIWIIPSDRTSIKAALQEQGVKDASGNDARRGGMLGMVPDGIRGAFHCKPGVDELVIGAKRGLMRICLEEGTTIIAAWFFGTSEMLSVVKDPFGILETISRKAQAGIMGYYGRWFLPVPNRVAVTLAFHKMKAEKMASPTNEQVEQLHQEVYGGLDIVYRQQRHYAGYPDRQLFIK